MKTTVKRITCGSTPVVVATLDDGNRLAVRFHAADLISVSSLNAGEREALGEECNGERESVRVNRVDYSGSVTLRPQNWRPEDGRLDFTGKPRENESGWLVRSFQASSFTRTNWTNYRDSHPSGSAAKKIRAMAELAASAATAAFPELVSVGELESLRDRIERIDERIEKYRDRLGTLAQDRLALVEQIAEIEEGA